MPLQNLLVYLLAIGFPVFYVYVIFTLDLFGTAHRQAVLISLIWGAIGAFGLSYAINSVTFHLVGFSLVVGLTAPVIEELLKSLVLVYYVLRPDFRHSVDGMVYGFAAGIGFAVVENIVCLHDQDVEVALPIATSRVLSTSFMHGVATALIGLGMGALHYIHTLRRHMIGLFIILAGIMGHIVFNNLVADFANPVNHMVGYPQGITLILAAIGMSLVGLSLVGFVLVISYRHTGYSEL